MEAKGFLLALIMALTLILTPNAQAEIISIDPCGSTIVGEQGTGGNAEWVMQNNCVKLEMKKNIYDPTIEITDLINERTFNFMAFRLEEKSTTSQQQYNTTIQSMGLTSNIDKGYVEWTNGTFSIGYKIQSNNIKFVGEINDWDYEYNDSDLWLDIKYHKNEGDKIEFIPVITDGVTQNITTVERIAGVNTFTSLKLGRGSSIIIDPVYYVDFNPEPARFYENGEQLASNYSSYDSPTTVTSTLIDGDTESKVTIEKKSFGDDDVLRIYVDREPQTGYNYLLRFYKRNTDSTSVVAFAHHDNDTINHSVNASHDVSGKGWFLLDITNLTDYMINNSLGHIELRVGELSAISKIEVSEVMIREEQGDNESPIISGCQVDNPNATCGENMTFSCIVTDNVGVDDVYFSGYINSGPELTYKALKDNNLYYYTFTHGIAEYGINTYDWTNASAHDFFNNEAWVNPNITGTYTCVDNCTPNWVAQYSEQSPCRINNTKLYFKTYFDSNYCIDDSFGLPSDNGTSVSLYCNYCDPDWEDVGTDCYLNETRYVEYFDNNFCYATTGLAEDEPPITDGTWQSCDYYDQEFDCSISDQPYIRSKIEYNCLLPSKNDYDCINYVSYGLDDVLQVNPQRTERVQGGLIVIDGVTESRETFTATNGLLNAYFTDKNLVAQTNFTITTICSNSNETLTHQKLVRTVIKDIDQTPTIMIWLKDNAVYIVVIMLLLIIASLIIGSLVYNAKGSYK